MRCCIKFPCRLTQAGYTGEVGEVLHIVALSTFLAK